MLIIVVICAGILGIIVGALFGGYYMGHKYCLKLVASNIQMDKYIAIIRLYDAWMMVNKNSLGIAEYLNNKGIYNIAIYGMDYRGVRLFHELKDTSVNVEYGVDRNPPARIMGLSIYHPDEMKKESVDAVIVTAVFSFDAIKMDLENRGITQVLALDDVIYGLL